MKIFLIDRGVFDYDTYDSVIVCAENEEDAKKIHPNKAVFLKNDEWVSIIGKTHYRNYEWVEYNHTFLLTVTYLGEATKDMKSGIILSSYNAG